MALIDPEGQVLQMNQAARQLLPEDIDPIGAAFATLPFWSDDPAGNRRASADSPDTCLAGEPYRINTTISLPDGRPQRHWISP